jgi:integrase
LRIGEVVALLPADVADQGDPRRNALPAGPRMYLRLRVTKTGRNQWAEVDLPFVRVLLRALVAHTPADRPLFPFSTNALRSAFKCICGNLSLSDRYVFHSLRHGAATRAYMGGASVETVMARGRWQSGKSARHYIQAGPAALLEMSVPAHLSEFGTDLLAAGGRGVLSLFRTLAPGLFSLTQNHRVGTGTLIS